MGASCSTTATLVAPWRTRSVAMPNRGAAALSAKLRAASRTRSAMILASSVSSVAIITCDAGRTRPNHWETKATTSSRGVGADGSQPRNDSAIPHSRPSPFAATFLAGLARSARSPSTIRNAPPLGQRRPACAP